ncbi:MAG: putative DNA binding domain-containing protein [Candidatus Methanoplasma sp.]|jgi:ATP-dependent DNA helicase RecG|nr:putative DNA binding domain-containing protein [Candidatus Methanoplasma sp.]
MENGSTEWKSCWKDECLKVLCAFANSKNGGILSIGIDDRGNPIGVSDPKDTLKKISDTTINTLGIYPNINLNEETGVITIEVFPSHRPVELRGKYYSRVGNTVQEIRGRELERFISNKIGTSWIDVPLEGIKTDRLDKNALDVFRKKASIAGMIKKSNLSLPDEELLTKLWLIEDGKLTRTAVLLFHPRPDEIVFGASVKISMFRGSEILYQDELIGSLITMPERISELLSTKYSKKLITYDGIQRIENDPYPEKALRECIANAVMHNDYSSRIPIQIRIWEDEKMMISDTGMMPEGWTLDTLMSPHTSIPFNPVLARIFSYAGYVEAWGRGIEYTMDAYGAEDDMKPQFNITGSSFSVTLKNRISDIAGKSSTASQSESSFTVSDAVAISVLESLNAGTELSSSEIMNMIGAGTDRNFTYRRITPLIKAGLVEKTIADKTHTRNQKYRITYSGITALNRIASQNANGKGNKSRR